MPSPRTKKNKFETQMKKQSEGEETRRKEKNQNQKISVVVNYLNICMNDTNRGGQGKGAVLLFAHLQSILSLLSLLQRFL